MLYFAEAMMCPRCRPVCESLPAQLTCSPWWGPTSILGRVRTKLLRRIFSVAKSNQSRKWGGFFKKFNCKKIASYLYVIEFSRTYPSKFSPTFEFFFSKIKKKYWLRNFFAILHKTYCGRLNSVHKGDLQKLPMFTITKFWQYVSNFQL
jgi:hypothetical protein